MKKQRKADAIPSVFPWNSCIKQEKDERSEQRDAGSLKVEERKNEAEEPSEVLMDDADISDVANWYTVESTDSNLNQDQDASNFTELEDKKEVCFTLIKLRQNKTSYELSRSSVISKTTEDNIWITRINSTARQFKEINF